MRARLRRFLLLRTEGHFAVDSVRLHFSELAAEILLLNGSRPALRQASLVPAIYLHAERVSVVVIGTNRKRWPPRGLFSLFLNTDQLADAQIVLFRFDNLRRDVFPVSIPRHINRSSILISETFLFLDDVDEGWSCSQMVIALIGARFVSLEALRREYITLRHLLVFSSVLPDFVARYLSFILDFLTLLILYLVLLAHVFVIYVTIAVDDSDT